MSSFCSGEFDVKLTAQRSEVAAALSTCGGIGVTKLVYDTFEN
jgi:hypothetical protein